MTLLQQMYAECDQPHRSTTQTYSWINQPLYSTFDASLTYDIPSKKKKNLGCSVSELTLHGYWDQDTIPTCMQHWLCDDRLSQQVINTNPHSN